MDKSDENGFVEGAILILVACVVAVILGFVIWTITQGIRYEHKYNAWVSDCRAFGGVVKPSFVISSNTTWTDCYVKGKVVIVPGWESEEKSKPYTPAN